MEASTVETTYFDPVGDMHLLIQDNTVVEKVFVVSSKAMMMVCDAWNRMLAPDSLFKEAQITGGPRTIPLPDDDSIALSILLNIAF